jgi:hypothetical protein
MVAQVKPNVLAAALALTVVSTSTLTSSRAAADDGGQDARAVEDAARDATSSHGEQCAALGDPCVSGQPCCTESAYCGSFAGGSGGLVCGLDMQNQLSTGSCAATTSTVTDGLGWFAIAVVAAASARSRKRRR